MNKNTLDKIKLIVLTVTLCIFSLIDIISVLFVYFKYYLTNSIPIFIDWLNISYRIYKGTATNWMLLLLLLFIQIDFWILIIKKIKTLNIE